MPKKKNYVSTTSHESLSPAPDTTGVGVVVAAPTSSADRSADIDIEAVVGPDRRNGGDKRKLLFSHWLGRGIDEWVWAAVDALTAELEAGQREIETIAAYADGLKKLFQFFTDGREHPRVVRPTDLRALHLTQFVGWLESRAIADGRETLQRTPYKNAKSGLQCLHRRVPIAADIKSVFPANPFSGASAKARVALPLSDSEQQRLADALKADLAGLHHGRLTLPTSQAATVHYLVVAMRVGGNTTPLLQVGRDALRPGLLPGTMILDINKHRAHKTINRAVKAEKAASVENETEVIPMDAVAVLRRMIAISAPLVEVAKPSLKGFVWLYRSERRGEAHHGLISKLTISSLHRNIKLLVQRHGLQSDDGSPLQLTTQRLRASLSHRAWRLSDGDPFSVAGILGNTARVVGTNYLSITDALKGEAAEFLSDNLTVILRGERTDGKVIPIERADPPGLTATPTARCGDTLNGERAPKDGTSHCRSFLLCLSCKSFVVVGEVDDLWRLFSFQQFLRAEDAHLSDVYGNGPADSTEIDALRDHLKRAIEFIDVFTAEKFDKKLLSAARARTAEQIHPFWALELRKAERSRTTSNAASAMPRRA